jgi:Leucine-rich repeat (LRR) protein
VRLLSYQHNSLTSLRHLDFLPSLCFLDCYANAISSLSQLGALTGLRILMLGRNQLSDLSGGGSCVA